MLAFSQIPGKPQKSLRNQDHLWLMFDTLGREVSIFLGIHCHALIVEINEPSLKVLPLFWPRLYAYMPMSIHFRLAAIQQSK